VPEKSEPDVTQILERVSSGGAGAMEELIQVVHGELRRQAARYLGRERHNHTLQPTALVNEAFMKLVDQRNVRWQNRAHFFGVAAQAMRRIVIDHARARQRVKRGGVQHAVTLDEAMIAEESRSIDVRHWTRRSLGWRGSTSGRHG
jgi:RNA polymerase sigma factor (TIGR02999 family)